MFVSKIILRVYSKSSKKLKEFFGRERFKFLIECLSEFA